MTHGSDTQCSTEGKAVGGPTRAARVRLSVVSLDAGLLILLSLVGLALRWRLMYRMQFSIDSDEAIVGLMAKHILEGRGIPVFYYGQHYMGSLEAILVAGAFSVFGISSVVLRAVPLAVSITLIPLIYLLGREAGGRRAGLLAAALCALPPAALVEWSTKPRGGFIEIVWLSALCLWCGLRWTRQGVPRLRDSFLMGLLLGVGWWINNQILFTIATIGLVWAITMVRHGGGFAAIVRRATMHGAVGVGGFLIGGAPFWIYNLQHSFASFGMFGPATHPLSNMQGLLKNGLPIIVGAKRFWSTTEAWPGAVPCAAVIYAVALIRLLQKPRTPESHPLGTVVPLMFILATSSIFSLSAFGWLSMAPRYLLPLYPALFVLLGVAFSRGRVLETIGGGVVIGALHLASSWVGGWPVPGEPIVFKEERVARDHAPVLRWLADNHVSWVRTNYWIGYRLAFETHEAVRFLVLGEPHETRIAEYEAEGEAVPTDQIPFILTPQQAEVIEQGMRTIGMAYHRSAVGSYVILHSVQDPLTRLSVIDLARLIAYSSVNPESATLAIDGSVATRWGSGRPQHPGMTYRVESRDGAVIRGIRIFLGSWWSDYPRGLAIECESEERTRVVLAPEDYRSVKYLFGEREIELGVKGNPCSAITLRQVGADPAFDWSIAELQLLR